MNTALRNLTLTLGALALAACSKDSRSAEDVLAEDSTLALEVMAANQDTLPIQVDTGVPTPEFAQAEPVESPAPKIEAAPAPAVIAQEAPIAPAPRRRAVTQQARRPRANVRPVSTRGSTRNSAPAVTRPRLESAKMKASALLPAGTELSLVSGQRICASMSHPGDRFTARISEDVVGPIGVVIPKGTSATAQIFSLERTVDLTMQSITLAKNTYAFDSDVTYTEVEKVTRKSKPRTGRVAAGAGIGAVTGGVVGGSPGAVIGAAGGALAGAVTSHRSTRVDHCVPEGGRITVRLTEPLSVLVTASR